MYHLPRVGRAGETLPPWTLPWLAATPPPAAEHGLGLEHGVSYFGPCTAAKVALEMERLTTTCASINARGYQPDGEIEGLFLEHEGRLRFFVRGGKHRAAALVSLGFPSLRARLRKGWPPIARSVNVSTWPLVASGRLDANMALAIHERYFDR